MAATGLMSEERSSPESSVRPAVVPLLEVRELVVEFTTEAGAVRAVDGVSLAIEPGRTLALVGESGCGKSVSSFAILCSIPGIGETTAFVLLIDMPELGALEPRHAASLAGLAPLTRQSGSWTGRRECGRGRSRLRHALFMPALVAVRFNPDLASAYQRLVQAGKPRKLAVVAVMRKLVLLANALLRSNRKWTPEPA